jgi:hypothetical protein
MKLTIRLQQKRSPTMSGTKGADMPRPPNYDFERKERDRIKAEKKAEKQAAKAAKKQSDAVPDSKSEQDQG